MLRLANWPQEMVLLFNRMGAYCQAQGIDARTAETMFNAGICARHEGRLGLFEPVAADPSDAVQGAALAP